MTFVHSCGDLGLFLNGYALDRLRDFWGLIERGEIVPPGAISVHVPLDILHQITQAFPFVVPFSSTAPLGYVLFDQLLHFMHANTEGPEYTHSNSLRHTGNGIAWR